MSTLGVGPRGRPPGTLPCSSTWSSRTGAGRSSGEQAPAVLVVDDNDNNRLLVRHLFDGEYRVLEAADGPEGLALVHSERVDCVLLDLAMPRMSGFEVLARLQGDPGTREIPVIILTATGDDLPSIERGLVGGAVDYLAKPIVPGQVAARVRGAIERSRLLREVQDLRAAFTSMLVHDLRGPLSVFAGYVDLVATTGPLVPRQAKYVVKMRESVAQMMRLIGDILDLSKLQAGRLVLSPRPVDLARVVTEMGERYQTMAEPRGIALEVQGAEAPVPVEADPDRLEQILMNLVGNALKFTPRGGAIGIALKDAGAEVEVAVTDTGPGITPEEMPLLFQPFRQTSTGQRAGQPGTGLGLVMCRHLVEAHGGRIWAESEPGRGSRFAFRLPRGQTLKC